MDAKTLEAFVVGLVNDLNEIKSTVNRMADKMGASSQVVGIKDLATRYQKSYNYIKYRAPYMMPNNGKSDFGAGTIKWMVKTVEDWESIPLEDRKAAWELEQRNKALLGQKNKGSR